MKPTEGPYIVESHTQNIKRAARKYSMDHGQYTYGHRGRTDKATYACWHTPVEILDGSEAPPQVRGLGYWKTHFTKGEFSRTLYTPSTFRIEVGALWQPERGEL